MVLICRVYVPIKNKMKTILERVFAASTSINNIYFLFAASTFRQDFVGLLPNKCICRVYVHNDLY